MLLLLPAPPAQYEPTSLCPVMVLSNLPSKAPHIFTVLSAAELASHWPSGLNLTLDTALVCPTRVNLRL